ncbi:MAG: argininosuccinate lyase [Desulfobacteraceae bacterium]|nr:argininosuccinate lyase [Desulfobacteraceae bacterium]
MSEKLWGGRFSEKTDKLVEKINASINVDKRLYSKDIEGSIAHVKMLAHESIIAEDEAGAIVKGLIKVHAQIEKGEIDYSDELEDIHMHVEDALGKVMEKASGHIAKKLHTARSRNDQIALDVRMYLKDEINNIISLIIGLQKTIVQKAQDHIDVVMPGYTHLQRAQPLLFSHHLMAYYEMFKRDRQRFEDCFKRTDVMPLGAAALAGTTYPVNREFVKELLEFSEVSENSIDAVSDRDFVVEFISDASIAMLHLSRFSEELILWSSSEFGFITISDAFTTGSSIMPQKKNPDVAELVRGKTGRVVGNLMAIITLLKSLPLAYNKDMQEDKEPLFDTVDTLKICLDVYARMIPNIKINKEKMQNSCSKGFMNATDLADYLTVKGVPFRESHALSGKLVAYALENKKELQDLSLTEFRKFSDLIEDDLFEYLTLESMIKRRKSYGGTSYDNVKSQIVKAFDELNNSE